MWKKAFPKWAWFQPEVLLSLTETRKCVGRMVFAVAGQGAIVQRSEYKGTGFALSQPRRDALPFRRAGRLRQLRRGEDLDLIPPQVIAHEAGLTGVGVRPPTYDMADGSVGSAWAVAEVFSPNKPGAVCVEVSGYPE